MNFFKKRWKLILALLILLFLSWLFLIRPQAQKGKVKDEKIISVKQKDLIRTVSSSGKIKADREVDLKFATSGLLRWVGVKEGDAVSAWQTIATLDSRELEKKLLKSLRDYSKERWDFEEDKTVTYKDTFITNTVKRVLEKNQFDLDKAVADVEIADLALQYSVLTTPISGIVTRVDIPLAGVNITPATAVFTVSDPDSLVFKADIDETDIGWVKVGQKVLITLDAYPDDEFSGKIQRIGFSAVTTSGGGNAYVVHISLPKNKNLRFKIGMNGNADVVLEQLKNVLVLPQNAVFKESGKNYVTIIENNSKVKKEVKTGLETEDEVQIKSGLVEKDKVVIENK